MKILQKKNIKFLILYVVVVLWMMLSGNTAFDFFISYGFSFNIANGLIPYSDFNMVTTPFSQLFFSLFLGLFSKNIIVYIIFYALVILFLFMMFDKLYQETGWFSILVLFSPSFIMPSFIITCSYNYLIILFILLLIYLHRKNKSSYLIGMVIGLSVFTKQNIGFIILVIELVEALKDKKALLKKIVGFMSVCLLFLIYFLVTKSLGKFIDQAFLGLFEFQRENSYHKGIYYYLGIVVIISAFIYVIKNRNIENWLLFSGIFLMTPLYDSVHFMLGLATYVILITNKINIKAKMLPLMVIGIDILLLGFIVYNNFSKEFIYPNDIKYMNYFYHPKSFIEVNKKLGNYLKKHNYKNVVIFDSNSYYYKITNGLKINHYLDLMNEGNYGLRGNMNAIDEIKSLDKDTVYIFNLKLVEDFDKFPRSQLDIATLEYFLKHAKKIDEIEMFSVYKYVGEE